MPLTDIMGQREITLGLRQVASIKIQSRKTIIAWKELLRLTGLTRDLDGLVVAAHG